MINDKFTEVKTLIDGGYYPQAKDECDNGVNMCQSARNYIDEIITMVSNLDPEKLEENKSEINGALNVLKSQI